MSEHKTYLNAEVEDTSSNISKNVDAEDEVISSERKSDDNTEVEATSSKFTKHAGSEDEVTSS